MPFRLYAFTPSGCSGCSGCSWECEIRLRCLRSGEENIRRGWPVESRKYLADIRAALGDSRVDLVMSDMAPNISGTRAVDQPRSMYLAELALDFCGQVLRPGGDFVCKLFQGEGIDAYIATTRKAFKRVKVIKPKASRAGSREVYLVARNYQL